ncbi:MAG: M23 family metallopeptidase [Bacteroidota bacterium]|nr:M23 family metallopeptidase [Bacteroidota bacterium]
MKQVEWRRSRTSRATLRPALSHPTPNPGLWLGWLAFLLLLVPPSSAQDPDASIRIELPTDNRAIFEGNGPAFYQRTARREEPGVAPPWSGGRYGFVRNVRHTSQGVVYSRFHEGIDIKPLRRSASGEPLDEVRSIDAGEVVYVNNISARSNYGRYVVVEHWWGGSPYYSLYAHLKAAQVEAGDWVARGQTIAQMGYTGRGINRTRAHLHLEINLRVSQSFQAWYDKHFSGRVPNYHGLYNGLNLTGMDLAELYLSLEEDSTLSIPEFVSRSRPFFEVRVPGGAMLDILWRYPWLCPELDNWSYMYGPVPDLGSSWIITFAQSGLPLRIESSDAEISSTQLRILEPSAVPYTYLTGGLIRGRGNNYALTDAGRRRVELITWPSPNWKEDW